MNTTIAPTIRQKIQIPYKYSAGPAMTKFLRGLQEKIIYASVCSGCGRRSVPPIGFCGRCWRPIDDYVEVKQRGSVESLVPVANAAQPPEEGLTYQTGYALILLEGCSTSLVHMVRWSPKSPLGIGSVVVPVWNGERTASILDIAYFQAA